MVRGSLLLCAALVLLQALCTDAQSDAQTGTSPQPVGAAEPVSEVPMQTCTEEDKYMIYINVSESCGAECSLAAKVQTVSQEACIELCAATRGCKCALYQKEAKSCRLKSAACASAAMPFRRDYRKVFNALQPCPPLPLLLATEAPPGPGSPTMAACSDLKCAKRMESCLWESGAPRRCCDEQRDVCVQKDAATAECRPRSTEVDVLKAAGWTATVLTDCYGDTTGEERKAAADQAAADARVAEEDAKAAAAAAAADDEQDAKAAAAAAAADAEEEARAAAVAASADDGQEAKAEAAAAAAEAEEDARAAAAAAAAEAAEAAQEAAEAAKTASASAEALRVAAQDALVAAEAAAAEVAEAAEAAAAAAEAAGQSGAKVPTKEKPAAAEESVAETDEPSTPEPTAAEPPAKESATKKVATEAPATEEAASQEPTAEEPTDAAPASGAPTIEEPITEDYATETPASEEPEDAEEPVTEEPAAEAPATEEPVAVEEPAVVTAEDDPDVPPSLEDALNKTLEQAEGAPAEGVDTQFQPLSEKAVAEQCASTPCVASFEQCFMESSEGLARGEFDPCCDPKDRCVLRDGQYGQCLPRDYDLNQKQEPWVGTVALDCNPEDEPLACVTLDQIFYPGDILDMGEVECICQMKQGIDGVIVCNGREGGEDKCMDKAGTLYAVGAKLPKKSEDCFCTATQTGALFKCGSPSIAGGLPLAGFTAPLPAVTGPCSSPECRGTGDSCLSPLGEPLRCCDETNDVCVYKSDTAAECRPRSDSRAELVAQGWLATIASDCFGNSDGEELAVDLAADEVPEETGIPVAGQPAAAAASPAAAQAAPQPAAQPAAVATPAPTAAAVAPVAVAPQPAAVAAQPTPVRAAVPVVQPTASTPAAPATSQPATPRPAVAAQPVPVASSASGPAPAAKSAAKAPAAGAKPKAASPPAAPTRKLLQEDFGYTYGDYGDYPDFDSYNYNPLYDDEYYDNLGLPSPSTDTESSSGGSVTGTDYSYDPSLSSNTDPDAGAEPVEEEAANPALPAPAPAPDASPAPEDEAEASDSAASGGDYSGGDYSGGDYSYDPALFSDPDASAPSPDTSTDPSTDPDSDPTDYSGGGDYAGGDYSYDPAPLGLADPSPATTDPAATSLPTPSPAPTDTSASDSTTEPASLAASSSDPFNTSEASPAPEEARPVADVDEPVFEPFTPTTEDPDMGLAVEPMGTTIDSDAAMTSLDPATYTPTGTPSDSRCGGDCLPRFGQCFKKGKGGDADMLKGCCDPDDVCMQKGQYYGQCRPRDTDVSSLSKPGDAPWLGTVLLTCNEAETPVQCMHDGVVTARGEKYTTDTEVCKCVWSGSGFEGRLDCTAKRTGKEAAVPGPVTAPPCEGGDCVGVFGKCFDGESASPCCDALANRCVRKNAHYGQCVPRWRTADKLAARGWEGTVLSDCPATAMATECAGKKRTAYAAGESFTTSKEECTCVSQGERLDWTCSAVAPPPEKAPMATSETPRPDDRSNSLLAPNADTCFTQYGLETFDTCLVAKPGSSAHRCALATDRCVAKNEHYAQCLPRSTTVASLQERGWTADVLIDCTDTVPPFPATTMPRRRLAESAATEPPVVVAADAAAGLGAAAAEDAATLDVGASLGAAADPCKSGSCVGAFGVCYTAAEADVPGSVAVQARCCGDMRCVQETETTGRCMDRVLSGPMVQAQQWLGGVLMDCAAQKSSDQCVRDSVRFEVGSMVTIDRVDCVCKRDSTGRAAFDCAADIVTKSEATSPLCTGDTCARTNEPCMAHDIAGVLPCCNQASDRCVRKNDAFAQCVSDETSLEALKAMGWTASVVQDCRTHAQNRVCTAEDGVQYRKGEVYLTAVEACACIQVADGPDLGWACQRIESSVIDSSTGSGSEAAGEVGTAFRQSKAASTGAASLVSTGVQRPHPAPGGFQQVSALQTGAGADTTAADGSGVGSTVEDGAVLDQGFPAVHEGTLGGAPVSTSSLPRKLLQQA